MSTSTFLVVFIQTGICLLASLLIVMVAKSKAGLKVLALRCSLFLSILLFILATRFTVRNSPVVAIDIPENVAYSSSTPVQSVVPAATSLEVPTATAESDVLSKALVPRTAFIEPAAPIPAVKWTISQVLAVIYQLGLLTGLISLGVGFVRIRKIRTTSLRVVEGSLLAELEGVATRNQVLTPRLYASREVSIPFVTGLFRNDIFVPSDWLNTADYYGMES